MLFMGRIMSSKASHNNFQEHCLYPGLPGYCQWSQNIVRQASEIPLCKNWEIAIIELKQTMDFRGMESSQAKA